MSAERPSPHRIRRSDDVTQTEKLGWAEDVREDVTRMAVEPKELLAEINTHREEQTNELEELRRQIAFFHTYFPEDICGR